MIARVILYYVNILSLFSLLRVTCQDSTIRQIKALILGMPHPNFIADLILFLLWFFPHPTQYYLSQHQNISIHISLGSFLSFFYWLTECPYFTSLILSLALSLKSACCCTHIFVLFCKLWVSFSLREKTDQLFILQSEIALNMLILSLLLQKTFFFSFFFNMVLFPIL